MDKTSPVVDFYGVLGNDYDTMTRDHLRWKSIAGQYSNLFRGFDFRDILDAGCGTGGEALELARNGYNVTGVDPTPEFIEIARNKAAQSSLNTRFEVDDFRTLGRIKDKSVDLVICRGNTLPHLLTEADITAAFRSAARVTRAGGRIVLQWLNYRYFIKNNLRMIGSTGDENTVFLRFYDFHDESVQFNLLVLKRDSGWQSNWITTMLRPWESTDVIQALNDAGWDNVEIYSDIQKGDFKRDASSNVFLTGKRVK